MKRLFFLFLLLHSVKSDLDLLPPDLDLLPPDLHSPQLAVKSSAENVRHRRASTKTNLASIGVILPNRSPSYMKLMKERLRKTLVLVNNEHDDRAETPTILVHQLFTRQYRPKEVKQFLCTGREKHMNTVFILTHRYAGLTPASHFINLLVTHLGLPLITWSLDSGDMDKPLTLALAPSLSHEANALLDLMRYYEWDRFSIVATALAGRQTFIDAIQARMKLLQSAHDIELLYITQLNSNVNRDPAQIRTRLLHLRDQTDTRVIMLFATRQEAQSILEVARQLGMTSREYVWLATKTVNEDLVTGAPQQFPPGMLAVDYSTNDAAQLAAVDAAVSIWGRGYRALSREVSRNTQLWPDHPQGPNFNNCYAATPWPLGGQLYHKIRNETIVYNVEEEHGMKKLRSFLPDGTLNDTELSLLNLDANNHWKRIGKWTLADGVEMDDITWPGDIPKPPSGRPAAYNLRVMTLEEHPYVIYAEPDGQKCPKGSVICRLSRHYWENQKKKPPAGTNLTHRCCSGYCVDLLNKLSIDLQFTFDLFEVEDGKWGSWEKTTQSWNGLVKGLLDNKADMVLTSLKINHERNRAIDFTSPFLETGITIVVALKEGTISAAAFLEPFSVMSWVMLFVVCVHSVAIVVFLFEYASPRGLDFGYQPEIHHKFSICRSLWLVWSMLFKAAVKVTTPKSISSRVLTTVWGISCVIFMSSYMANLAAFMITKEDYFAFEGIQDRRLQNPFSKKPAFKFATIPDGATEAILKSNFHQMYEYMKQYNKSDAQAGIAAVLAGDIDAFIYDATVLVYNAGRDQTCRLRTTGKWYAMTGYGVGLPKESKWTAIINSFLIQYQHIGFLEGLQDFWLTGACDPKKVSDATSQPLAIGNFYSAFVLLIMGLFVCTACLIFEHLYFKFGRRHLKNLDTCGCCSLLSLSMGQSLSFKHTVESFLLGSGDQCEKKLCNVQTEYLRAQLKKSRDYIDNLEAQLGIEAPEPNGLVELKDQTYPVLAHHKPLNPILANHRPLNGIGNNGLPRHISRDRSRDSNSNQSPAKDKILAPRAEEDETNSLMPRDYVELQPAPILKRNRRSEVDHYENVGGGACYHGHLKKPLLHHYEEPLQLLNKPRHSAKLQSDHCRTARTCVKSSLQPFPACPDSLRSGPACPDSLRSGPACPDYLRSGLKSGPALPPKFLVLEDPHSPPPPPYRALKPPPSKKGKCRQGDGKTEKETVI